MNRLRSILTLLTLLLTLPSVSAAAPTASELIDEAATKLRSAKSVTIGFTATGSQEGQISKGLFTIAGDRFVIDSPEAKVWYDGKTQWAWTADGEEVNITEPTIEEVAQVNPYAILCSLRSRYKARYQGQPSARTVVLTPSMPDPPILHAVITFAANGYPSLMKLRTSSGENITINITSVTPGNDLPVSTFRFTPAKVPGAEIIDLR